MNFKDERREAVLSEKLEDAALNQVSGGAGAGEAQYVLGDTVRFKVLYCDPIFQNNPAAFRYVEKTGVVLEYKGGMYVVVCDGTFYEVLPQHVLGKV